MADFSLASRQKLYLTLAFTFGVLVTLGFKDFHPDLERRFRKTRAAKAHLSTPISRASQAEVRNRAVALEDHTVTAIASPPSEFRPTENIVDGIEGCIGNTPLVRIKSLSEATGCDILAKAEVWLRLSSGLILVSELR